MTETPSEPADPDTAPDGTQYVPVDDPADDPDYSEPQHHTEGFVTSFDIGTETHEGDDGS